MDNSEQKQQVEAKLLQFLTSNPDADLFTSEEVLDGKNTSRSDKHILSHLLKKRGYQLHLSPKGSAWSNRAYPKWINLRRDELEAKLRQHVKEDNPSEIITRSFLERFYPTAKDLLTRRSDQHLVARILSEWGWSRKIVLVISKTTPSKMARIWVRPRPHRRSRKPPNLLMSKDPIK